MLVLVFLPIGDFILGEAGVSTDVNGDPGIERDTYTWNADDHSFTRAFTAEANGDWVTFEYHRKHYQGGWGHFDDEYRGGQSARGNHPHES